MDANFWHERWDENRIGFHQEAANPLLVKNFKALALEDGARIFVPLCGKSLDIAWLLDCGHRVVGAELSRIAIEQLFNDLGVEPIITKVGDLERFSAPDLDIYVGDIFDLTADQLGPVDAAYDRAALVALPDDMRARYAKHLHSITGGARQLLICFEYDQSVMNGPPFSVSKAEIERVHGARYSVQELSRSALQGGLKGKFPAQETVWLLSERR